MSCAHDNTRLLSQLAGRYRLGMVSNFYGNLATVCDELGLRPYLGVIADSTDVGWTKPDPHIFRHALDELGVTAAEAAFVGDSLARDMAGARGIGMSHIWLVGGSVTPSAPCCPGDPVIHSLDDLRELLL
jgi:putative hydrolase of the HAD superfamily